MEWKEILRKAGLRKVERGPPKKKARTEETNSLTEDRLAALHRLEQPVTNTEESLDSLRTDWKLTYTERRAELEGEASPQAIHAKYPGYKSIIGREIVIVTNIFNNLFI